jgi:gluconate kinase
LTSEGVINRILKTMQKNEKLNLLFFGPPGVGKSTVGEQFSRRFNFDFYEGDQEMTDEEKKLVSTGGWDDAHREALLERTAQKINLLHDQSETGLVTSIAMTKQWMREFLSERTDTFLQFVLVISILSQLEMEALVEKRHQAGHPITVEAFKKYTAAFDQPTMPHHVIQNPHDPNKQEELFAQMDALFKSLR